MSVDLYVSILSPPCQAVLLTAEAVGVKLNVIPVDVLNNEQMKPEFVALNPTHTVPTLVDGDFVLWESRAIMAYLVEKFGKNSPLYPKDPQQRAQVDRLLYFDLGTFYSVFLKYAEGVLFNNEKPDPAKLEKVHETLELMEIFLEGHLFAVSNRITLADHSLIVTIGTLMSVGVDLTRYRKVSLWAERCRQNMPGYDKIEKVAIERMSKLAEGKFK